MDNDYIEPEAQMIYLDRHISNLIKQYIYIDDAIGLSGPDSSYGIIKFHLEKLIKEDLFVSAVNIIKES